MQNCCWKGTCLYVNGHKPILFTFLLRLPKLFSIRISNENRIDRRSENDQWTAKSQNHLKRPKISKFLVKEVTLHFRVFLFQLTELIWANYVSLRKSWKWNLQKKNKSRLFVSIGSAGYFDRRKNRMIYRN